jgi:predicted  nucleic acid-binding Zn-ribbon protein
MTSSTSTLEEAQQPAGEAPPTEWCSSNVVQAVLSLRGAVQNKCSSADQSAAQVLSLQADLQQSKQDYEALSSSADQSAAQVLSLQADLQQSKQDYEALSSSADQSAAQVVSLQADLQQAKQLRDTLSSTAAKSAADVVSLTASLQQAKQEHEALSSTAAKSAADVESLANSLQEAKQEHEALSSTAAKSAADVKSLTKRLQEAKQEHEALSSATGKVMAAVEGAGQAATTTGGLLPADVVQQLTSAASAAADMRKVVVDVVERLDPFEPTDDSSSYADLAKALKSAQEDSSTKAAEEKHRLKQAKTHYAALSSSAGKVLAAVKGTGPPTAADSADSAAVVSTVELNAAATVVQAFQTTVRSAVTSLDSSNEAAAGSSCSQLQSLLEATVQQCVTLYSKVEHASACLKKEEWAEPAAGSSSSSSSSTAVELGVRLFSVTQDTLSRMCFLQLDRADLETELEELRARVDTQQPVPADSSMPGDSEAIGDTADSSLRGGSEYAGWRSMVQQAARVAGRAAAETGTARTQHARGGTSMSLRRPCMAASQTLRTHPQTGPSAGQRRLCSQPRPKQLMSWRSCNHLCSVLWA